MKRVIFLLLPLFCWSCEMLIWDKLDENASEPRHLYSCAISYPDDYDWKKDTLDGNVTARVLLFQDTSSILDLEASSSNHISKDPDCHHIINGNLISEYSSSSLSWVKRNGKELFTANGRERIQSLAVLKDSLYLLMIPRNTETGFTLRRNADILMQRKDCTPIGKLHVDNGKLCFAFREKMHSTGDYYAYRYYSVVDTCCTRIEKWSDCLEILGARRFQGVWNYLITTNLGNGWLWRQGDDDCLIDVNSALDARDFGFVSVNRELYVHAQILESYKEGKFWNDIYWSKDKIVARSTHDKQVTAFCEEAQKLCFACTPFAGTAPVSIYWDGKYYDAGEDYRLTSSYALCCSETNYYVGLNSESGKPVLCSRDEEFALDFNGFFTCLEFP